MTDISQNQKEVNLLIKRGRKRLEDIDQAIAIKQSEKEGIEEDIQILSERLKIITKSTRKKQQVFNQYDKLLKESEDALTKLKESTRALLGVVRKQQNAIEKATKSYDLDKDHD